MSGDAIQCANCNGEIEPCGHGWTHIGGGHQCPIQPEPRMDAVNDGGSAPATPGGQIPEASDRTHEADAHARQARRPGTARAVLLARWPHVSAVAAAQAAAAEREACAQIAGDYLHAAADGTTFPTVAVVINRMAAEIAALIRARGGG